MASVPLTPKQEVERLLRELPESSTLEDIQYHLYVLEKIRRGQADVDAGRVVSHEQAKERLRRWTEG
jgi:predicted transcriptional regulator